MYLVLLIMNKLEIGARVAGTVCVRAFASECVCKGGDYVDLYIG